MKREKPYRPNVGIVVFNSKGQVLAGEREDRPGCLQFPQGGIDGEESPLEAAYRELEEETGLLLKEPPVFEFPSWLTYDFPAKIHPRLAFYRGQKQKWFFFFWDGSLEDLNFEGEGQESPEFSALYWAEFEEVCQKVISFKKEVYQTLYLQGPGVISKYLALRKSR